MIQKGSDVVTLSLYEFCVQNNITSIIQQYDESSNQSGLSLYAMQGKCITNEIYNEFIDFFKQNGNQITSQELDTSIQKHHLNVIEGILATYKQYGLDIIEIVNLHTYQIREIEFKFILYLSLFFAKAVIEQKTIRCEVRVQRVKYLYNLKSKSRYGRADLSFSTYKYGNFKIELKSLSPFDYREASNSNTILINKTMHIRLSLRCGQISTLDQLMQRGLYQAQSYNIKNTTSMAIVLLRSPQSSRIMYSISKYNLPDIEDLSTPVFITKEEVPQLDEIMTSALIQARIDSLKILEDSSTDKGVIQYDTQAELQCLSAMLDKIKVREQLESDLKKSIKKQKRQRRIGLKKQQQSQATTPNTKLEEDEERIPLKKRIPLPRNGKVIQKALPKQLLIQHFMGCHKI